MQTKQNLKEGADAIMTAANAVVTACDQVIESESASDSIRGVRNSGLYGKVKALIKQLKEQVDGLEDSDLQSYLLQSTELLDEQTRKLIEDAKAYGQDPKN